MKSLACLAIGLLALCATPIVSHADDGPVQLCWYPKFSPDGTLLATGHGHFDRGTGEIRIWEAATGKPKQVIATNRGVRSVGWLPTGDAVYSGDYEGLISVFDVATGGKMDELRPDGANVEVVRMSPDGKKLIAVTGNGSIFYWDWPSKQLVKEWTRIHQQGIFGIDVTSDWKTLATGGRDGMLRTFDLEKLALVKEIKLQPPISSLQFSRDNSQLFAGCNDSLIHVLDVASGSELRQIAGHDRAGIGGLALSVDGSRLASCGADRSVRIWDVSDASATKLLATWQFHADNICGVAISPDGKLLASAGWDNRVIVRNLVTNRDAWSWSR